MPRKTKQFRGAARYRENLGRFLVRSQSNATAFLTYRRGEDESQRCRAGRNGADAALRQRLGSGELESPLSSLMHQGERTVESRLWESGFLRFGSRVSALRS